ncbi:acyl-CoA N-acyltransferase [Absidia repens]|uniref:Histone acetyltransferase type B catalytic subunit n=1 Tax=Absidia repens TaxID=90262 RepID=A0A1X2IU97_9FUNG|nr:acyl-CoA N-acyltransferase [Absidia repens]
MEPTENHPAQATVSDFSNWAVNTTECMELGIVTAKDTALFSPEFTYPLFGMHETAFGYKDLAIKILYTSGSLRAHVSISSTAKYQPSGSSSTADVSPVLADDVPGILKKYMAPDTTTNLDEFMHIMEEDLESFRPMGEKVHEYQVETEDGDEGDYEIYKCSFKDRRFREYHRRMQFFVLLFIEGSSYIEEDDEKWELYTIFKREKNGQSCTYHFVGYCSAYPFYCWPDKTRMRISQFLILPPYQNMGHGGNLYETIFSIFTQRKDVIEVTVEDPNESFSDMRDKCDLRFLQDNHGFDNISVPVPMDSIQELQKKFKLTNRQTQCCIEMYLLSNLDKRDKKAYKAYRLQVKQRLYRFNYDALQEIDPLDRKEKLQDTYSSVEQDYHRLLERI